MSINIHQEQAALQKLSLKELRTRYAEVFDESARTNNKTWLIRRILWRLQVLAEGDLSERARQRATELANDADLRLTPPRTKIATPITVSRPETVVQYRDGRLPPSGNVLTRLYHGENLEVKILAEGFEFREVVYHSLSAVAKAATGSHCNGFAFFRLNRKGGQG